MHIFKRIKAFFKLRKIQNATGIKLKPYQRKIVLNPKYPMQRIIESDMFYRGRGKTLTAIFWTLVWRKDPIWRSNEYAIMNGIAKGYTCFKLAFNYAIPDPDLYKNPTKNLLDWTFREYNRYAYMCWEHKIHVAYIQK